MIKTNLIVARSQNGIIGKDGQIPWTIPEDLEHFKKLTYGKAIVMGRKTYESIGRVLPNRLNIVVSSKEPEVSDTNYNLRFVKSLQCARELAVDCGHTELWVIGGERLYKDAMSLVSELHITEVHTTIPYRLEDQVAKFMPDLDPLRWEKTDHVDNFSTNVNYEFTKYERRKANVVKDAETYIYPG